MKSQKPPQNEKIREEKMYWESQLGDLPDDQEIDVEYSDYRGRPQGGIKMTVGEFLEDGFLESFTQGATGNSIKHVQLLPLTPEEEKAEAERREKDNAEDQALFEKNERHMAELASQLKRSWNGWEDRDESVSDHQYWEEKLEDLDDDQKIAVSYIDYRARDLGTHETTVNDFLEELLKEQNSPKEASHKVRVTKVQILPLSQAELREEGARRDAEREREEKELREQGYWRTSADEEGREQERQDADRMHWESKIGQLSDDQEVLVTYRDRDTNKEDSYSTTIGDFLAGLRKIVEHWDIEKVQTLPLTPEEQREREKWMWEGVRHEKESRRDHEQEIFDMIDRLEDMNVDASILYCMGPDFKDGRHRERVLLYTPEQILALADAIRADNENEIKRNKDDGAWVYDRNEE